jgi:hypothetical protein
MDAGNGLLKGLSSGEYFRPAAALIFGNSSTFDDNVSTPWMVMPGDYVTGLHRDLIHDYIGGPVEKLRKRDGALGQTHCRECIGSDSAKGDGTKNQYERKFALRDYLFHGHGPFYESKFGVAR